MATIGVYDHGKCHCGTRHIEVGCKVTVYSAEVPEEGAVRLREWMEEAKYGDQSTQGTAPHYGRGD